MTVDKVHEIVKKLVLKAKKEGATSLDLSEMQLTELPEEIYQLVQLETLDLSNNRLRILPREIGQLTQLKSLFLRNNYLSNLPEEIGQLIQLENLYLRNNSLETLPKEISQLILLENLQLNYNSLETLPKEISQLTQLENLYLRNNSLKSLPAEISQLKQLKILTLVNNPLNPDLAAAYEEGLNAVMTYLVSTLENQILLYEAKLVLVGEGEVGKTCLIDALEDLPWKTHESTHGIKIRTIFVTAPDGITEITLNGWDFGGQRVYRPTHQLFFSPNAVYLVVWKPRSGTNQGMVKEWINLVKHREPDAKILVVATHDGPDQRQADIDRQELWNLFGKDTVIGFFQIDSKPDGFGVRKGIPELKEAIAKVASGLPEMGRSVSEKWQKARQKLTQFDEAYLPLHKVYSICNDLEMEEEETNLFLRISHRLGYLIHYQNDTTLQDLVVLKPDWLATAISFVFDDVQTRKASGLVSLERLGQLWNDPQRKSEERYPENLHPIFLRLMERFDLSYKVADNISSQENPTSLIAQLVHDNRPEDKLSKVWPELPDSGDKEQIQICEVVDEANQSATAEGLFYQLIVRLHRYSLGRNNYNDSIHWQKGLVIDADYNGRALLEHIGNNIRITVRAAYPEGLLSMLTSEVKYLVDEFWEGLRCNVMVPCIEPCGKHAVGTGRFEVGKLIVTKRRGKHEFPCPAIGCDEWQNVDELLTNAPSNRTLEQFIEIDELVESLTEISDQIKDNHAENRSRFDGLDSGQEAILSKVDISYQGLLKAFTDEAKEGPRLFSVTPVDKNNFNPQTWTKTAFRITLWCEHTRQPLPRIDIDKKGVYEIEVTRDWFKKIAPYLNRITSILKLALPAVVPSFDLKLDDESFDKMSEQLKFSEIVISASLSGTHQLTDFASGESLTGQSQIEEASEQSDTEERDVEFGKSIESQGGSLRALQALLKEKDPTFGGLVRVMNKRQEFLWVHPTYVDEY